MDEKEMRKLTIKEEIIIFLQVFGIIKDKDAHEHEFNIPVEFAGMPAYKCDHCNMCTLRKTVLYREQ